MWIENALRKRPFERAGASQQAIADNLIANAPVSSLITPVEAAT
ncbi:hypothetical protein VSR34_35995 [Paraburkholderia sp. JHI2823]